MGIEFYKLNSLNQFNEQERTISLSEELQEFIHENRKRFSVDLRVLLSLDPCGDVILNQKEILELYNICDNVLNDDIITEYEDKEEINLFFIGIKKMCKEALDEKQRIITIGD